MTQTAAAEPLMVPGYGALGVVPPAYVPANDNVAGSSKPEGWTDEQYENYAPERPYAGLGGPPITKITGKGIREQEWFKRAIANGVRPDAPLKGASFYADDIEIPTLSVADLPPLLPAAIEMNGSFELTPESPTVQEFVESVFGKEAARGPFIQTYTGIFHPFDPRPEDVRIEDIAHGLANTCRYSGACERCYSVAEHSVHIAWWLFRNAGPHSALAGLLHDAPEALSGFGDVASPVKRHCPVIVSTEDAIYRRAVAPAFGLSGELPAAVKMADERILADELANMKPMAWHARYSHPLGVTLQYWEPAEAEARFLAAFTALSEEVRGMDI